MHRDDHAGDSTFMNTIAAGPALSVQVKTPGHCLIQGSPRPFTAQPSA